MDTNDTNKKIKVLMLSTDLLIFDKASIVFNRIFEYGKLIGELHVIVYTKKSQGFQEFQYENIKVYPTNCLIKPLYFRDAHKIARTLIANDDGEWLITAQDPFELGFVGYQLGIRFKIPLQIQVHTDLFSKHFKKSSLKNFLRASLCLPVLKSATNIRVVSERIKESLISVGVPKEKIFVLPIFVDKKVFETAKQEPHEKNKISQDDFLILTVARKAPEKNIDLANEIVGELKRGGLRVKWFHIGYGPKEKEEKKWLDEFIENPEAMAPYYKMADLFLLTSNYEGYGMAAVEAAAAGVPVVMTDVGVAIGRTFPVGDKAQAVAIIDELIKNPDQRKKVINEQEKFFQNWPTKEQYLEAIRKTWESCLYAK